MATSSSTTGRRFLDRVPNRVPNRHQIISQFCSTKKKRSRLLEILFERVPRRHRKTKRRPGADSRAHDDLEQGQPHEPVLDLVRHQGLSAKRREREVRFRGTPKKEKRQSKVRVCARRAAAARDLRHLHRRVAGRRAGRRGPCVEKTKRVTQTSDTFLRVSLSRRRVLCLVSRELGERGIASSNALVWNTTTQLFPFARRERLRLAEARASLRLTNASLLSREVCSARDIRASCVSRSRERTRRDVGTAARRRR